jgi:hypothetical protein
MSDDEKFKIIGKVVSDHEAAKKRLEALQVKGKMVGEFLHLVANTLTGNAKIYELRGERGIKIAPFNMSRGGEGDWPTFDELSALLREICSTKQQIEELGSQRKELGV